ncbi:MAG TPA: hypothetical protein VEO91_13230 [Candidatus Limnocylindria bacterium]|nr:hypothetical protein [Candidatus Limnocylindria bacterium]
MLRSRLSSRAPIRRRLTSAAVLATTAVLALSSVALSSPAKDDELLKDEQHRLAELKTNDNGTKAGSAWNMEAVGHHSLGDRGFNADVWVHDGFAYVGHWGFTDWATGNTRFCPAEPNNGVAVVDVRDPSNPAMAGRLQNPAGTSAEDVVVYTAEFGPFTGHDIAAAGIQVCGGSRYDTSFKRGLILWDVTDPTAPVSLGFLDTGCCTRGLHEFEVENRVDLGKTFAYASVPTSEYPDPESPSGRRDRLGRGDFRLIDISDPAHPVEVSNWGVIHDGVTPAAGQGCDPDGIYGHSAEPSADGKLAFLSWWDSGFIAVDVSDPASPVFKGRTVYPSNADGDGHSASYDDARSILFTADEDFCKASGAGIEKGFGYLRAYDYSNLSAPQQIGDYRTPNSLGTNDQGAGDYVIHNPLLVGTDVYASWYTDGVRVIEASDPRALHEVAYFVPPAGQNPVKPAQRSVLTNTTQVWGVAVDEATGLIYASDMNTGLWILRRTDQ